MIDHSEYLEEANTPDEQRADARTAPTISDIICLFKSRCLQEEDDLTPGTPLLTGFGRCFPFSGTGTGTGAGTNDTFLQLLRSELGKPGVSCREWVGVTDAGQAIHGTRSKSGVLSETKRKPQKRGIYRTSQRQGLPRQLEAGDKPNTSEMS